jgi:hypothetical protein
VQQRHHRPPDTVHIGGRHGIRFEFAGDVLASSIVLIGIGVAARPADDNHPYGHGRFETLSAFVVGVILASGGVMIGYQSLQAVGARHSPPGVIAAGALVGAVMLRGVMSSVKFRVGRERSLADLHSTVCSRLRSDRLTRTPKTLAKRRIAAGLAFAPVSDMMMPHLRCRHLDSRHTNRVAFQFFGQVHRAASVRSSASRFVSCYNLPSERRGFTACRPWRTPACSRDPIFGSSFSRNQPPNILSLVAPVQVCSAANACVTITIETTATIA